MSPELDHCIANTLETHKQPTETRPCTSSSCDLCYAAATVTCFGDIILVSSAEAVTLGKLREGEETQDGQEHSGAATEEMEYPFVAKHTLGAWGGKAADGFIVLQNFGSCVSYLIIIGELMTSLAADWIDSETLGATGKLWRSFYFLLPVMVLLFVLPPCLIRHFSNLRFVQGPQGVYAFRARAGGRVISLLSECSPACLLLVWGVRCRACSFFGVGASLGRKSSRAALARSRKLCLVS